MLSRKVVDELNEYSHFRAYRGRRRASASDSSAATTVTPRSQGQPTVARPHAPPSSADCKALGEASCRPPDPQQHKLQARQLRRQNERDADALVSLVLRAQGGAAAGGGDAGGGASEPPLPDVSAPNFFSNLYEQAVAALGLDGSNLTRLLRGTEPHEPDPADGAHGGSADRRSSRGRFSSISDREDSAEHRRGERQLFKRHLFARRLIKRRAQRPASARSSGEIVGGAVL